jgi:hypothetical protein
MQQLGKLMKTSQRSGTTLTDMHVHYIMELTNCTISRSMSGSKSTVL